MARTTRKPPSRATQRREELARAARIRVPASCDICVVGGGAAGLTVAITAAEAGARVVVLEREATCGRTILATGNGRCNFCNLDLSSRHYNDPDFVRAVYGPDALDDILGFFGNCGMAWTAEEGRLYPLSRQASSVRELLLARAHAAQVVLAPAREATGISRSGSAFAVFAHGVPGNATASGREPAEVHLSAKAVVVAVGGGVPCFARDLGLPARRFGPVLCPLACEASPLQGLDGRRAQANTTLVRGTDTLAQERGEVLFRSYGLSGIVVFDLSRRAQPGDTILLDLLPDLTLSQAQSLAERARGSLYGMLDPMVADLLLRLAKDRWWPRNCGAGPPAGCGTALSYALALAKRLPAVVEGAADPKHAQVQRGGLACSSFDPATLGARSVPGVYACGEALDVDGDCGGYNLSWAWKSGMVAGLNAARFAAKAGAHHT